jgi:hypothetical protein
MGSLAQTAHVLLARAPAHKLFVQETENGRSIAQHLKRFKQSTVFDGPQGQSYFSKSTKGLQKACALRQGAQSGVVRREPEIFPG